MRLLNWTSSVSLWWTIPAGRFTIIFALRFVGLDRFSGRLAGLDCFLASLGFGSFLGSSRSMPPVRKACATMLPIFCCRPLDTTCFKIATNFVTQIRSQLGTWSGASADLVNARHSWKRIQLVCLQLDASRLQSSFFAYSDSWKLFYLQLELFHLQLGFFCYNWSFLTYSGKYVWAAKFGLWAEKLRRKQENSNCK